MHSAPADPTLLDRVPTFALLTPEEKAAVAAIATEIRAPAGSTLFREAYPVDDLYFVLEGRISLSIRADGHGDITVLSVGPGDVLGWAALLHERRVATARVVQAATLLRIQGPSLHALCERDHDIGYAIMKQLFAAVAQRLHDTRLQLLDMFGKEAQH